MAAPLSLTAALATYAVTAPLKDGRVNSPRVALDFVELPVLTAIRRMVRDEEAFDVCEMPLVTYLLARAHGKPFTALPVFVQRRFPHAVIRINSQASIRQPSDLQGKVAGARAYTDTTGVWGRGLLADEYRV